MRRLAGNTLVFALLAAPTVAVHAVEPVLTVKSGAVERKFLRTELLSRSSRREVKVKDPSYKGQPMTYSAIPVVDLFKGINIPDDAVIVFKCLDGFSAPLEKHRLLNPNPSDAVAYIAIERADEKWPRLKKNEPRTPAPFYLIWQNPEKSKIGPEEWPYQLSGFEIKASIAEAYPGLAPDKSVPEKGFVQRGYKGFIKHCFACHTLNGEGTSNVGPDLNSPFSPIDYLKPEFLRILVRNPQDLRKWPGAKMQGFSKQALPEEELEDIISYLKHMSQRRAAATEPDGE
jgi:mono/diheme cytochrome c family protein